MKTSKSMTMSAAVSMALIIASPVNATDKNGKEKRRLLLEAAVEDVVANTATLPIARGVDAGGQEFWYTITEASTRKAARRLSVNEAEKLNLAADTAAVQKGEFIDGVLHLQATVDFSPILNVVPDPDTAFPPLQASPGSIGEAGYSPLVQLPGGLILNAPHVANDTGVHDKVVGAIDEDAGTATFRQSEGLYEDKDVYYISFDASAPDVAALENATYAPSLNAAPIVGSNDDDTSARSGIAPFVNGQTGVDNPERQGLISALLGEGDPLNVIQSMPDQNEYSPLWDVHLVVWSDAAVAFGKNTLQGDFDDLEDLAEDGLIAGPAGPFGAVGVIVNCPVVSIER